MDQKPSLQDIVALAKRRGFFYPGSEIYGGLANTWDYGPLGAELKKKIKDLWWQEFVEQRVDMVGLDSAVISSPRIWEASGHVASFADSMVDCKECKTRTRADHLVESATGQNVEGLSEHELDELIAKHKIKCPECGKHNFTKVRKFNQLFPVHVGILAGDHDLAYLRGETAQGIFVNFKNILDSTRVKLPFGVGQMGKSFRNEITKGQATFRTIEFEQAEIEYFFDPSTEDWEKLFDNWLTQITEFVSNTLGINSQDLRVREHTDEERSFYSQRTVDLEYNFPFGFKELWGLAYRTDYDLSAHAASSGQDLSYLDPTDNKRRFIPHVIEPAVGIDRLLLAVLCSAYWQDSTNSRLVLKLKPSLAPYNAAIFPLLKNKPELVGRARKLFDSLSSSLRLAYDDRGNIGKRYYYQDEMGTPFCITVDHETLEKDTVTVRDRDTTRQERVSSAKLGEYIATRLRNE